MYGFVYGINLAAEQVAELDYLAYLVLVYHIGGSWLVFAWRCIA